MSLQQKEIQCKNCGGTGRVTCSSCNGDGKDAHGLMACPCEWNDDYTKCLDCEGKGLVAEPLAQN